MDKFLMIAPGFERAFMKWVVIDQQALSVGQCTEFKEMIAAANKKLSVPSRAKLMSC